MCKLVVGINKSNSQKFKDLIVAQEEELKKEDDGMSALVVTKSGEKRVIRSFDNYNDVFNGVYKDLDNIAFIIMHSRTGTSGAKDMENVHLFREGDWLFAHNGFVSGYNSVGAFSVNQYARNKIDTKINGVNVEQVIEDIRKRNQNKKTERWFEEVDKLQHVVDTCPYCSEQPDGFCIRHQGVYQNLTSLNYKIDEIIDKEMQQKQNSGAVQRLYPLVDKENPETLLCDSLRFLKHIKKPLTRAIIDKEMEEKRFSGMGIFYNMTTGKVFMIVDKPCKCITDSKTFATYFSYEPETRITLSKTKSIFGVDVSYGEKDIEINMEVRDIIHGIYEIDTETKVETKQIK
jgi:hypothetical protein